ncbi:hypothetical protein D6817_05575, partial [Candidatus Pacearchaeota archaeon]
ANTNSQDQQSGTGEGNSQQNDGSNNADNGNDGNVMNSPENVEFHPGKLCSAEELQTNCGPTKQTTCLPGREEVYFVDSCGNPANIYDASKINDLTYWSDIKDKKDSCNPDQSNAGSQTCGNCNYLLGGYCREATSETGTPTYGGNICASLNCPASDLTGGKERIHGESWCGFDTDRDFTFVENRQQVFVNTFNQALNNYNGFISQGTSLSQGLFSTKGKNNVFSAIGKPFFNTQKTPVGSKFYRYLCSQGKVIVEPCAEFRQEECIETDKGGFSEAACRVNRWQDCTSIFNRADCENTDQRDCVWLPGIEYVLMGGLASGTGLDQNSLTNAGQQINQVNQGLGQGSLGTARQVAQEIGSGRREIGACVPKTPPGLKFWQTRKLNVGTAPRAEGRPATAPNINPNPLGLPPGTTNEAGAFCAQANAVCPVTYEKGLLDSNWKCVKNCECLQAETQLKRAQLCMALGDCGPKVNYVGEFGSTRG